MLSFTLLPAVKTLFMAMALIPFPKSGEDKHNDTTTEQHLLHVWSCPWQLLPKYDRPNYKI